LLTMAHVLRTVRDRLVLEGTIRPTYCASCFKSLLLPCARLPSHFSVPMTSVSELNSNWLLEDADFPQEWRLGGRCLNDDMYL